MNPGWLCAVWLASVPLIWGAAHLCRSWRMAAPIVAAIGVATVVVIGHPAPLDSGPLSTGTLSLALGRPAEGLLVAIAAAVALCLLTDNVVDAGTVVTLAIVGAASTLLLSATSPEVWGSAALVAVAAISLRWVIASPGRTTLAAGRIACLGAAILMATAPFVPVPTSATGPWPILVGGLLAVGAGCLLPLLPLSGWVVGGSRRVSATDLSAWALLLTPALLVTLTSIPAELPDAARVHFTGVLLTVGLLSAIWNGAQTLLARSDRRPYTRVLLGDVGLAAAAIGTAQTGVNAAVLLLILLHLAVGPALLSPARQGLRHARAVAWLAVSGVPLSPAFWGRLLVMSVCAATSMAALVTATIAAVLLSLGALRWTLRAENPLDERADLIAIGSSWVAAAAAVALGIFPHIATQFVFGVGS